MNIYDIAKEAGVSISTVSKYLNNKNIRPELRKRVEEVINKHNFVPNQVARGLASKSMKTVAVMVVDLRLMHYAQAAFFIDKSLSSFGYRVVICNTLGKPEESINYIKSMININIDGFIFIGSIFNYLNNYPEVLKTLDEIPVVCVNGHINVKKTVSVFINDKMGIYEATKYLIKKGRKNIHYIKYLDTASAINKKDGYEVAMMEAGLPRRIHSTNEFSSGGYKVCSNIIANRESIDGIICGEDLVAMGVMSCLKDVGYQIGKEVDVIGFNASEFTSLCDPRMTSVDNLCEESSEISAKLMLKLLNDEKVEDVHLNPHLVIKKSA